MTKYNTGNKSVVYWGTGKLCDDLLKNKRIAMPDFFIDSSGRKKEFYGKKVYLPNEIDNWQDLFVVITIMSSKEVEVILQEHDLHKGKDYLEYREIVEWQDYESIKDRVKQLKKREGNNSITLFTMVCTKRDEHFKNFFAEYKKNHANEVCVTLLFTDGLDCSFYEKAGFILLDCPEIMIWNGYDRTGEMLEIVKNQKKVLTEEELRTVAEIEEMLTSENRENAKKITAYNYWNLKEIFELLQPEKLFIWGGSKRMDYILSNMAQKYNIPYCYLEFGYIPGTILMDRMGVGGRSEYVLGNSKLKNLTEGELKEINVPDIFRYIRESRLDTGIFIENSSDEEAISRLDNAKKCVFFPASGDRRPFYNTKTSFWRNAMSPVFESSGEALLFLAELCKKNDWQLIYKQHPPYESDCDERVEAYKDVIFEVKDMEIDKILNYTDTVVCFYSAIEFKTLIHKKPLVQLGHSILSVADCSYKPENKEDLEHSIRRALKDGFTKEQEENFEIFAGQLLKTCLWDNQNERELRYGLDIKEDKLLD